MKKTVCITLVTLMLCIAAFGCAQQAQTGEDEAAYKIAVIVPREEADAELFAAAKRMMQKHMLNVTAYTLPADYTAADVENSIKNVAEDANVKAIIIAPAGKGVKNGINAVKQLRNDVLFICASCGGDEVKMSECADIVFDIDRAAMGTGVADKAGQMGALTLIHYSFTRELNEAENKACRTAMREECEKLQINMLDVTIPDPEAMDDASQCESFIAEDVPRQVGAYGTNTAFYCTNSSAQAALIKAVADAGAIYPLQNEPTPFAGYIDAFDIDMSEHVGDVNYALAAINAELCANARANRMSTWRVSPKRMFVETGVEYALLFAEGETVGKRDDAVLLPLIKKLMNGVSSGSYAASTGTKEESSALGGSVLANSEDTGHATPSPTPVEEAVASATPTAEAAAGDAAYSEAYTVTKRMDGGMRLSNCYLFTFGYFTFGK